MSSKSRFDLSYIISSGTWKLKKRSLCFVGVVIFEVSLLFHFYPESDLLFNVLRIVGFGFEDFWIYLWGLSTFRISRSELGHNGFLIFFRKSSFSENTLIISALLVIDSISMFILFRPLIFSKFCLLTSSATLVDE